MLLTQHLYPVPGGPGQKITFPTPASIFRYNPHLPKLCGLAVKLEVRQAVLQLWQRIGFQYCRIAVCYAIAWICSMLMVSDKYIGLQNFIS